MSSLSLSCRVYHHFPPSHPSSGGLLPASASSPAPSVDRGFAQREQFITWHFKWVLCWLLPCLFFSLQLFPMMFVNILKVQRELSCTFETFKLFLSGGCYSEQYVQYRKILRQCCLLGLRAVLKKYTCTLEKKRCWGKIGGRRAERKEKSWAVPWNLGFLEKSRSKIKLTFTLLVKKQWWKDF